MRTCVEAQGDQTRQGGDRRAKSADIGADEQACGVAGESREHDRGGDVADDLAGKGGDEDLATDEDALQRLSKGVDVLDVPTKMKKHAKVANRP